MDELGIETHGRGFLTVDDTLQTVVPTIYRAGDVIGGPAVVYTTAYEGQLAAENALKARPAIGTPRPLVH